MAERKVWARELQVQYNASVVTCCNAVGISRTAYYYEPKLTDDTAIIDALNALIEKHHRWGFPKCFKRLRKLGHSWSRGTLIKNLNTLAESANILGPDGSVYHFTYHQFRHTTATRMINNGVPQHIVQRYLGHETPTDHDQYVCSHYG